MGVVMSLKLGPKSFYVGDCIAVVVLVVKLFIRTAQKIPDSLLRPSTNKVLVIAMKLRVSFLDDGAPNGIVTHYLSAHRSP